MSIDKQIEEMTLTEVDILANDINQHCADLKENYCGDTHCVACLAHALTAKGYRKASDVAREIITDFANMIKCHSFYISDCYGEVNENMVTVKAICEVEAELKKKYTESEKKNDRD